MDDQHQTTHADRREAELAGDAGRHAAGRAWSLAGISPVAAGRLRDWGGLLDRAHDLGFRGVLLASPFAARSPNLADRLDVLHPALGWDGDAASGLRFLGEACAARGLDWVLDVVVDRVDPDGALARSLPAFYALPGNAVVDPRRGEPAALARPEATGALADWWSERLAEWRGLGAAGFRLLGLAELGLGFTGRLVRAHGAGRLIGDFEAASPSVLGEFAGCGLDFASVPLGAIDAGLDRVMDGIALARAVAAPMLRVECATGCAQGRAARLAALLGDAWVLPLDTAPVDAGVGQATGEPMLTEARLLAAPGLNAPALASGSTVVLVNPACDRAETVAMDAAAAAIGHAASAPVRLEPGEVRRVVLSPARPVRRGRQAAGATAEAAAKAGRVALERIEPAVEAGRFAAKRRVGETVAVAADILCDGHDELAAVVQYRPADEMAWRETRMVPVGNDRWRADFVASRPGRWLFRVQAWRDAFATFRDELAKKSAAGVDVQLELREGHAVVAAKGVALPPEQDEAAQLRALLSPEVAAAMAEADERPLAALSPAFPVDVDRVAAGFAAWYEIFPRSMSDDVQRHGTLHDVIRHLPRIRDMGFDVLYFPPIHPIGRVNRKGRNNALRAEPGDPGSPYAIGSEAGGHEALHPELGTLEDFRALMEAAAGHGLEIALDFAIQCAPDHPWVTQHRGWFAWRPDGSMKYAENPPKKYEDIVNVDFYAPESIPALWVALAEVVLFWAKQGVRTFRVDNPHTKPFPFWEWLIEEVRGPYPDAVFLAEAFTRPKIMNRLAKLGFTQSYTYFTWRNTKREITDYLTELSTSEQRDFFRPNFFVNTPDINPPFLQTGGRAAHLIRATLAATLSGLWGVYSGFELCEATPIPGREEYLDSEKYQLRAWDWDRPGNIVADITRLNRLRRRNAALQSHLGVTFLPADDDQVLFYEKATEDRANVLLIAVSLDPHQVHSAAIELPLWRWGLPDQASLACEDLLHDTAFTLAGKWQSVTLTPEAPAAIWRARPLPRG